MQKRLLFIGVQVFVLIGIAGSSFAQTQYSITLLGLTGPDYSTKTRAPDTQFQGINQSGEILGFSYNFSAASGISEDPWIYNGNSSTYVGLTGSQYDYQGLIQNSATLLNDSGWVLGIVQRYNSAGAGLGGDGWVFNGTSVEQIGFTGPGYGYTYSGAGAGTIEVTQTTGLNDANEITGQSFRYNQSGERLGQDAWILVGNVYQQIGLTGAGYAYNYTGAGGGVSESSDAEILNAAGQVAGFSQRYDVSGNALGQDAWVYNANSYVMAGLTGSAYSYSPATGGTYQNSTFYFFNDNGIGAGISFRFNSSGSRIGTDTWYFNGNSTTQIGLTGPAYSYVSTSPGGGNYETSNPQFLNRNNQVAGFSLRFNSLGTAMGQDTWISNGNSTQQIGLTGTGYFYASSATGGGNYQSSTIEAFNDAGQAVGYSSRYNSSGTSLGQDVWYSNGTSTQAIGLFGAGYNTSSTGAGGGTYQYSDAYAINKAGQIAGDTNLYTASGLENGQVGWFFDPAKNSTMPLEFSVNTSTGYTSTSPRLIMDSGDVLGSYTLFDGSQNMGNDLFLWSQLGGFHDLGSLIQGGLTNNDWLELDEENAYLGANADGSPNYIVGTGQQIGQNGAADLFLLTSVPEPTMMLPIALGALLLRRSSRRSI